MTAFDDILKSEQEAEELISGAKEEVAQVINSARGERKVRIEAEVVKLNKDEKEALESHKAQINVKTEQIKKRVAEEVASIEKKFESHKSDLVEEIKKKFA